MTDFTVGEPNSVTDDRQMIKLFFRNIVLNKIEWIYRNVCGMTDFEVSESNSVTVDRPMTRLIFS